MALSRRRVLQAGLVACWPAAHAEPAASPPWPALPRLQGQGTLRFLGLAVYDARLWVGTQFNSMQFEQAPLGLEIGYRRAIRGRDLVDRSLQEMARGGPIEATQAQRWRVFMAQAFPDVREGDRLLGEWWPEQSLTRLHAPASSGRAAVSAELADPSFGPRFFGIWLAPHSSEPALRSRLLGMA